MNYNTPQNGSEDNGNGNEGDRQERLARHEANARRALGHQPKYIWPKPGDDMPRLTWVQYLNLHADEFAAAGSPPALALADAIRKLAYEGEFLGAWSPESHEQLAQAAYEQELALTAAMEASFEDFNGSWNPGPDPDETDPSYGHGAYDFDQWEDQQQREAAEMN